MNGDARALLETKAGLFLRDRGVVTEDDNGTVIGIERGMEDFSCQHKKNMIH